MSTLTTEARRNKSKLVEQVATTKARAVVINKKTKSDRAKAKPLRESATTAKKKGVAFLIESELERAEVVLAAKAVTTKLQDFAENLSTIEAKDIMPMLDSFRETFGPRAADQFSQVATAKIRDLISAVQSSKNAIDGEITRLEQMVNGGDSSDVALGGDVPPPALDGADIPPVDGELPVDGPPADLPSDETDLPPEENPAMGATGFAGRARKESAKFDKKGRRLTEENVADDSAFKDDLAKLSIFSPKCYVFAHDILDSIHDLAVGGDIRNKLMKALGHVVSMAQSEDVWDDPESVADLAVATHFVDVPTAEIVRTPEVAAIVKNLRRFAHMVALKHGGDLNEDEIQAPSATLPAPAPTPVAPIAKAASSPLAAPARATPSILTAGRVFEGRRAKNVKRLRESSNPDRMILTVFRNVFRECRDATRAVHGTARAFNIDASDVVLIIREAKSNAVDEAAVPSLMGVPMGQPDVDNNPALMAQNPTAANPVPGQPNKPMTPADMRANNQAIAAQDKAAGNNAKAPIIPPKTMAPVQQVKPMQVPQTPSMNTMTAQQKANQGKSIPPMPGKVVNNNNMRTL